MVNYTIDNVMIDLYFKLPISTINQSYHSSCVNAVYGILFQYCYMSDFDVNN